MTSGAWAPNNLIVPRMSFIASTSELGVEKFVESDDDVIRREAYIIEMMKEEPASPPTAAAPGVVASPSAASSSGLTSSTLPASASATGTSDNWMSSVARHRQMFEIDMLSQSAWQDSSFGGPIASPSISGGGPIAFPRSMDARSCHMDMAPPYVREESGMQTRPAFSVSPHLSPPMNNDWGCVVRSSTPSHHALPSYPSQPSGQLQSLSQPSSSLHNPFQSPRAPARSPLGTTYPPQLLDLGGPTYQRQNMVSSELEPNVPSGPASVSHRITSDVLQALFSAHTQPATSQCGSSNRSTDKSIPVRNEMECSEANPRCHCCKRIASLERQLTALEQLLERSGTTTRPRDQVEKREPDFTNPAIIHLKGAAFIKGLGFTNAELDNLIDECQGYMPHRPIDLDFAKEVIAAHNCREAEELAKWLVLESFSLKELNGRNCGGRAGKQAIDKERMREIKRVVLQSFPTNEIKNDRLWVSCTDRINRSLRYLSTKFKHNPWIKVGLSW